MKHVSSLALGVMLISCVTILPCTRASAATTEIFPSNADTTCNEEFENVANALRPGDVLILRGGTYTQTCRRAITVGGTAANPITIRAADGENPIITRPQPANFNYDQNNIEIVSSSYLTITGLHFKGGDGGVTFVGGHHITFENNEIYETGNNAIRMNSGSTDSFIIRRNHIHHTGLLASSVGLTEGEGMYVGCNNATCIATNHLIEGNYIHHTRATSDGGNDGIEVKVGSYGNIIRNNVIHDTISGTQYPCIFVYGGGNGLNIVDGNAMWNCGEAIQVVSDAVVRNNLILNSVVAGISAAPHAQVSQMRNVTIVNNTIYGNPDCLYIRWSGASNMVLANNAVYCPGTTAVNASGLTGSTITVRSNYVEGSLSGASIDGSRFGSGGSASSAFLNPSQLDFWPRPASVLIGKADTSFAPALDFNERTRMSPFDVGAYETDGLGVNLGWKVGPGFKQAGGASSVPPAAPTSLRLQ
jgi:parallel beta helix pectate lyase-like protein